MAGSAAGNLPDKGTASRPSSGWWSAAVDLSLLLAVFLAFFWRFIFMGDVLSCLGETRDEAFPLFQYTGAMLCKGVLPLWDPYSYCGFPHAAIGYTGAFYPTSFVFGLGDYATWSKVAMLPHIFLGMAFSYLLGRSIFRHRAAAVALGVLHLGCYPVTLALSMNNPCFVHYVAWFPLCLLCLLRLLDTGRWPWAAGLLLGLVMEILGSAPHGMVFLLTSFGLLTAVDLLRRLLVTRESFRGVVFKGVLALAAVVLAFTAAAAQVGPSMELLGGQSARALPSEEAYYADLTLPLSRLVECLAWPQAEPRHWYKYWLTPIGLSFCVFALAGRGASKTWVLFVTLLAGSVFLFGGSTPFWPLISRFLVLIRCRGMVRIIYALGMILPVLAACGVDRMLCLASERRFGAVHLSILAVPAAAFAAFPVSHFSPGAWASALAFAVLAAGGAASLLSARRAYWLAAAGVAALAVDLWGVPIQNVAAGKPEDYDLGPEREAVYAACDGVDRKYLLADQEYVTVPPQSLCPGLLARQRGVNGYNAVYLARFVEFMHAVSESPAPLTTSEAQALCRFRLHQPSWVTESMLPALDLLNVRYVAVEDDGLAWADDRIERGEKRFSRREIGDFTVYENHKALPLAFTIHEARVIPGRAERLDTLLGEGFDYRREALLETPFDTDALRAATGDEPVDLVEYAEHHVELSVAMTEPGLVVLTDMYYPGWHAMVDDGPAAPALCVDHVLRGVFVPEGSHRIRFEFRPATVRNGLWISNGVLAMLAAVMLGALLRARPGSSERAADAE